MTQPAPPDQPDDRARRAYGRELRESSRQAALLLCGLAVVLVPCFGVLDAVVFPQHLMLFLCLRAACAVAVAGMLWFLTQPIGHRRPEAIIVVVACLIAITIDVMIAQTDGAASRYYAGLSLVLLSVTVLMPWTASWAAGTAALVVSGYLVTVALAGPVREPSVLVNNLFFLVSTGIITTVGSQHAGRLRWREFTQRTALEVAIRHRSDFMAKMSHELRTPLHAIIGYADMLLEDGVGTAEDQRLVERIRTRGLFLHRMISDLLDYAKAEAGKMEVQHEPVDVAVVVDHTVAALRPLVERKGLCLDVRIAPNVPTVSSDAHRLEQILTNLLANAAKFTERGGITVDIRLADGPPPGFAVLGAAHATAPARAVAILVTDTGVGVHDEDLRQLASDFHQLSEVAERFGGTGLGLSISRRLAELLGGLLVVQSRHGVGSTFGLLLPCPAPAARVGVLSVPQLPRAWMDTKVAASSSS